MLSLNILYPIPFYPHISGGFLRTFNIAKIASRFFDRTNLVTVDENFHYDNKIGSLYLKQHLKYKNFLDKISYLYRGLFSSSFSWKVPDKYLKKDAFFQIEEPLFYNALVKNGIENYVLNEHNVNWEIYNLPGTDIKEKIFKRVTRNRNRMIEENALLNAKKILVCSERDKNVFINALPALEEEQFIVVPNCIEYEDYEGYLSSNKREDYTKTVIFLGTFTYYPNIHALKNVCRIAKLSSNDIQFKIIGKNPPKMDYPDNVLIMGYVDDIKREILNSDLCIAPLEHGSGTRLKILEYFAMGKPVISTSKGAEGIEYTPRKDIIIEDDIHKYPQIIETLIDDEKEKGRLGRNAKTLIKDKYDWKIYEKPLFKVYEELVS